jgi:hypothetical protein
MAPTMEAKLRSPIVVRDLDQLRAYSIARPGNYTAPLILSIPQMSQSEAFAASERITKARSECGCDLGARAMAATFAISLAAIGILFGPFTLAALERLPIAVVAAFLAAGLGKAIGIALARNRARAELMSILTKYSNPI